MRIVTKKGPPSRPQALDTRLGFRADGAKPLNLEPQSQAVIIAWTLDVKSCLDPETGLSVWV